MEEKDNNNPFKGFFEKLGLSLPPEALEKIIISTDIESEDYNKTYLQKADELLSQQYEMINKLYQTEEEVNNNE